MRTWWSMCFQQWAVALPTRVRYFLNIDVGCLNRVAGIVMREVQRATAGASTIPAPAARSGGVLFVHRFGAALNAHVHLHLCVLDEVVAQGRLGLEFRGAQVDEACAERVQAAMRQRVQGLFERRGILSSETVAEMQGWGHRGVFSVHAGVRVEAPDGAGRERLLRNCARPIFAGERLVWAGGGAQVRYRLPRAALQGHRLGPRRSIELRLSASELGSNSGVDTAAAQALAPLLWCIGAEIAVADADYGAIRPEADGGEQGTPAKAGASSCRCHVAGTGDALYLGAVAGAHLRGVCAAVQQVRRTGAPSRVHHRAGHGAADTGTGRGANNCTSNRTGAFTTAGDEWTAADCSGRGV